MKTYNHEPVPLSCFDILLLNTFCYWVRYFWKLAPLVFSCLTFKLLNCNMCFVSQGFSIGCSLKRERIFFAKSQTSKIHLKTFKYTWNRKEQWISFCLSLNFIIYQDFAPFAIFILYFPLLKYLKNKHVVSLLHTSVSFSKNYGP